MEGGCQPLTSAQPLMASADFWFITLPLLPSCALATWIKGTLTVFIPAPLAAPAPGLSLHSRHNSKTRNTSPKSSSHTLILFHPLYPPCPPQAEEVLATLGPVSRLVSWLE